MARELPSFHPYLDCVLRFLGCHRDEMADAVIEAGKVGKKTSLLSMALMCILSSPLPRNRFDSNTAPSYPSSKRTIL
jgi:hypothetical protein